VNARSSWTAATKAGNGTGRRKSEEYDMRRVHMGWMLRTSIVLLCVFACANPERANVLDPVNTPSIVLSELALSDGAILVSWRYLVEGDVVVRFVVNRIIDEASVEVGRVDVQSGSGFRTASIRDTSLTFGVDMEYRISAVSASGAEVATARGSIILRGTELRFSTIPRDVTVRLTWGGEPSGTLGYRLLRSVEGSNFEVLFETEDREVRSYDDVISRGSTPHRYALETRLSESQWIRSGEVVAELFSWSQVHVLAGRRQSTTPPGDFGPAATAVLGGATDFILPLRLVVTTGGNIVVDMPRWQEVGLGGALVPYAGTFDIRSISLNTNLRQANFAEDRFYVAGYSETRDSAFLLAFRDSTDEGQSGLVPGTTGPAFYGWRIGGYVGDVRTWPSSGGTRTGMTPFGTVISASTLLFYEGTVLREIRPATELALVGTAALPEQPLDIEYVQGAVWLAFPDHLLHSNPVTSIEEISSWVRVEIPQEITLTRFGRIWEEMFVILDGSLGKLHLLDTSGILKLSWDAFGPDLEDGDVMYYDPGNLQNSVYQSDGDGVVHQFEVNPVQ